MKSKQPLTLKSPVTDLPFVGPSQAAKLQNLHITTIKELLFHFPIKYRDTSMIIPIQKLKEEGEGTIKGEVISIKNNYIRSGKVLTKAVVSDESDKANIIWFNQRFLIQAIKPGELFLFELKLPQKPGAKDFYCSDFEKLSDGKGQAHLGRITPFYDQTAGVSSKWLRARLAYLKPFINELVKEELPEKVIINEKLLPQNEAVKLIHFPENFEDVHSARERLGFDEMLHLAVKLEQKKRVHEKKIAFSVSENARQLQNFISKLPFELTSDQHEAINEILTDLNKSIPMNRLLNGDVGSGKTVVAAAAAYLTSLSGFSTVVMAPTTVLAQQHYRSLEQILDRFDIKIQLLTSGKILEPTIKNQVIVGTHAILYEQFLPKNVALVIVDEQHRFGVAQREKIRQQEQQTNFPHYLTMTATPIPRTLTNVIYGDMDVSIIKQMPKHRLKIDTRVVPHTKSEKCFEWIAQQIIDSEKEDQAYIIFPLIDESEKSDLKAATQAYEILSKTLFKDLKVGLLHGRLKDHEKDEILMKFKAKNLNILISTTVIEVGIDVPDATIMAIENAERFGLAQLHQLRGRVGRGSKQSFCFVMPSKGVSKSTPAFGRLEYFAAHSSGFDVAEYDLKTRGPGEVYGSRQSGIPDLKIADMTDLTLLTRTRKIARELIK